MITRKATKGRYDNTPKHPLLPSLGGGQISTRTYDDKYTYLWQQVHVLLSTGYFCGLSEYTRKKITLYKTNKETGNQVAVPNAFPSRLKTRHQGMMTHLKVENIAFGTIKLKKFNFAKKVLVSDISLTEKIVPLHAIISYARVRM